TWEEKVEEVAYKIAPDVEGDNVESIQKVKGYNNRDVYYVVRNADKAFKHLFIPAS
ncbi:hypothetical protein OMAG_001457, partial [Candidatus Omnitrophus magneticus]